LSPPTRARRSRHVALALLSAVVLGLHLALLWQFGEGSSLRGTPGAPDPAATPGRRVSLVHLRFAEQDPTPAAVAAAPEAAAAPDPGSRPAAGVAAPASAPTGEPMASATASASAPAAPASATGNDAAMPPGRPEGEDYLPRSALTLAPQALGLVALSYPEEAPAGQHQGVLTLFIDEQGVVQRVRIESGDQELPPVFQEAARQAFLAARFTPGELQGRAVKSRIRIQVSFEAGDTSRQSGAL
jgi:TonB family protein